MGEGRGNPGTNLGPKDMRTLRQHLSHKHIHTHSKLFFKETNSSLWFRLKIQHSSVYCFDYFSLVTIILSWIK